MHDPVKALTDLPHHLQEPAPVLIATVDVLPAISARGHVVKGAGELDA
jgi:hypothetical protein